MRDEICKKPQQGRPRPPTENLTRTPHCPGSDFDFVVTTIFLISIFTGMKPTEKLVREDDEIKPGPIPNCHVKYRWRAKSKL